MTDPTLTRCCRHVHAPQLEPDAQAVDRRRQCLRLAARPRPRSVGAGRLHPPRRLHSGVPSLAGSFLFVFVTIRRRFRTGVARVAGPRAAPASDGAGTRGEEEGRQEGEEGKGARRGDAPVAHRPLHPRSQTPGDLTVPLLDVDTVDSC